MSSINAKNVIVFRKRLLAFSETFIADQARFLPSYHADLVGYTSDDTGLHLLDGCAVTLLEQQTCHVEFIKLLYRLNLPLSLSWEKKLHSLQASLIHAHFFSDGLDAIQYAKRLNIPVITTLHGHDITKKDTSRLLRQRRNFFQHVDKVIAVSDFIAEQALVKGCPESKLVKHSIGIDIDKFKGAKEESDAPSLLFVGRLVEKKGVTYLLDALAQLQKTIPDISLTVVGEGKLKPQLEQQVLEQKLNVNFVGKKTALEIKNYLLSHWLFTAPSITANNGDAEGLGMVFLEAQALQTPVISFKSGGVVEAVDDGNTGLLCAEKDVASLADNIAQLIKNTSLRHKMGQAGRQRVEQLFNIKKQCKQLEVIYDDVCGRG